MPTISWYGGDLVNQILPAGSGEFDTLGWFGAGGFGFSVAVGSYQDTSFSCNDDGSAASGAVPNLKFASATGAFVGGETSATPLSAAGSGSIQLGEATLNVIFDSNDIGATSVQNISFRTFDGSNINNPPSGVTAQAFELRSNPSGNSTTNGYNTDGQSSWTNVFGSGSVLDLSDQIWPSGLHKFWLGVSGKPNSIGQKLFAHIIQMEFM